MLHGKKWNSGRLSQNFRTFKKKSIEIFNNERVKSVKDAEYELRLRYIKGELTSEEYTEKMSRL